MLPQVAVPLLRHQFERARAIHDGDLRDGFGAVWIPEVRWTRHAAQNLPDFSGCHHHRQSRRPRRAHDILQPRQRIIEHMSIEEEQCVERLVLRGSAHVLVRRQPGQEAVDLFSAHRCRMPFVVEEDEALDPLDVRLLRPAAVMTGTHRLMNLVHQFRLAIHAPEAPSDHDELQVFHGR